MALKQKFTWKDFLRQNPEYREKKVKRTSPEGEKAFNAAFKKFTKEHLKERESRTTKEEERVASLKGTLVGRLKGVDGRKWHTQAKQLNKKIGRYDAYLARLAKEKIVAKELSKKV